MFPFNPPQHVRVIVGASVGAAQGADRGHVTLTAPIRRPAGTRAPFTGPAQILIEITSEGPGGSNKQNRNKGRRRGDVTQSLIQVIHRADTQ